MKVKELIFKVLDKDYKSQLSINLISSLLPDNKYFPITTSSLHLHSLACVINDIVINKRNNIVEFGSGLSTIVITNLIKRNSLDAHLYSVEDNHEWYLYLKGLLSDLYLEEYVTLIYAPLKDSKISLDKLQWYDIDELELLKNIKIHSILIDGPAAWTNDKMLSRYPAIKFCHNSLASEYSIFLDDTNRKGEKLVMEKWQDKYDLDFTSANNTFSVAFRGQYFNPII